MLYVFFLCCNVCDLFLQRFWMNVHCCPLSTTWKIIPSSKSLVTMVIVSPCKSRNHRVVPLSTKRLISSMNRIMVTSNQFTSPTLPASAVGHGTRNLQSVGAYDPILFLRAFPNLHETHASWWLNQPLWKIVKMGSSSPIFGVKIKNIWNHHPVMVGGSSTKTWLPCKRHSVGLFAFCWSKKTPWGRLAIRFNENAEFSLKKPSDQEKPPGPSLERRLVGIHFVPPKKHEWVEARKKIRFSEPT